MSSDLLNAFVSLETTVSATDIEKRQAAALVNRRFKGDQDAITTILAALDIDQALFADGVDNQQQAS